MATAKATETNRGKRAFSAEVSRVLHLMIHSLYTNKDIFLRELVSNASDACDKLRYRALSDQSLLAGDPELRIVIRLDEKAGTIDIADNGIGMNEEELIANLGTIARSGTREFAESVGEERKGDLIGQFGVGFYSSFMVADRVEVVSRKAGEDQAWRWHSEGLGEYEVEPAAEPHPRGTRIRLFVRDDAKAYLDRFKLSHIVSTYSDHIGFPILLAEGEEEPEAVNAGSALWTRAKSDITAEQYTEFYHHVAHSPDEPWLVLHNTVEGKVAFTNLLFIPTMKPFDLFHPDRRRRVKLYVRRVFITDENVDIVPSYLRFLRGIVDSEDLPLNISRETLQDNPMLRFIREGLTNRVLTEIGRKAQDDPEGFTKFWSNFGPVMKEGLCEANVPRDKLLEVCCFVSTAEETTSLSSYVERMKEGQDDIYYLTGDSLDALRRNPQLEGFTSRGIEVMLFADHVDDFWVSVVQEYRGKTLKSVTRAGIDLAKFGDLPEAPGEAAEESSDAIGGLIAALKEVYGEEIKDVRTTSKLSGTPACLAVGEGEMDMRMERFLLEHKQLPKKTAKLLEINPHHPLIRALASQVAHRHRSGDFDDAAFLLLDQARIVEGEAVSDPAALAGRLSRLMEKHFSSSAPG